MLADFIFHVAIVGVEFFQFGGEGINFFVSEFRFSKAVDEIQDVQGPAAIFYGEVFAEGFYHELRTDVVDGNDLFLRDQRIRASTGIRFNAMLHLTQPAPARSLERGLAFIIAMVWESKNAEISINFSHSNSSSRIAEKRNWACDHF